MKVAIVIGHSICDQGAINQASGLTEYAYNETIAHLLSEQMAEMGIRANVVERRTYEGLPGLINSLGADLCVELHCNAYNQQASGTEMLYFYASSKGRQAAQMLQTHVVNALGLPDRGLKPTDPDERGGYLLLNTNMPCVICEPFFIDNDRDVAHVTEKRGALVRAYADAIDQYRREVHDAQ